MVNGPSCGHDFDFHFTNWYEAAQQLGHGVLYPHWAATPAWNAGEPRFIFYPPLSWTLGALLGFVMPWTWTPIAYTWIALLASGVALWFAARELGSPPRAALLAAVLYMANPYMLFTAYERTAYAELLAAAWLPLLLAAALRERPGVLRIAVPVALLWLTNAPAAVMGCYSLALIATARWVPLIWQSYRSPRRQDRHPEPSRRGNQKAPDVEHPSLRFAGTFFAGTLLGLGLGAFYIVPAAYERRWVQIAMAVLPGMRISDNFLFHRIGDAGHDTVLHTASVVAVELIALTAIALAAAGLVFRKTKPDSRGLAPLAILALVLVFLLTPPSAAIWNHTPELAFLQFPWRLLAILAVIFALALAKALSHMPSLFRQTSAMAASGMIALAVAMAFMVSAYGAFRQPCYPEDTVAGRLESLHSENPGSEPTDEYTPVTADNDPLAQQNPPWWLADDAAADAPDSLPPGPAPRALDLNPDHPQTLILNLRRYPAWNIQVNGSPAELADRDDGLIAIPLAAGAAHVRIRWQNTADHAIGNSITAVSFGLAVILWFRRQRNGPLQDLSLGADALHNTRPAALGR
ncbi:MAG: hypothetical protein FWD64_07875 [Acidobacteriaceae bacterium]|nr:hypothetical protein [Acidobacteriaceae bacterium]